ncbi:MAG: outer membrane beta-barrel protein [Saprospiraceae bacterium]|nr:outer membrane beta-barrel protein [Candidatus Brachybacter algidus]
MKIFLPFLLLIVSLSAFGQFSSSLDCVGAMNIGYRYINPHKSDVPSGFVDIRNKEQVGLRADFGLNFNKKFGSKLYFKTGLRMANKGYNSYKLNTLKWGLDGKDGVYHPDFPTGGTEDKSSQFKYHYFFLEMPVMIRYEFIQKSKISIYMEAGSAVSYYLQSVTVHNYGTDRKVFKENEQSINDFQISAILGVGLNYQLNNKTQLFLQPTFNYQLTDLVSAPVNEHLYSAGLELGCRHRIK